MARRLLITRARHDIANQYLYVYSEEIIEEAKSEGWKTDKADDEKNNRAEIESRLEKTNPEFVFFNGHGSAKSVHGYKDEELVGLGSAQILSGKIVFARSCSALKELGAEAVRKGCRAFIGYKGEFLIPRLHAYESRPAQDPVAKKVLGVSNMVCKLILKGKSVEFAVGAAQQKAGELILEMLTSQEPYDSVSFRAIYQNYSTLSFEGDSESRVN